MNGWQYPIRDPSYLGLLIASLGWALVFRAGCGVIITALSPIPLLARIRAEERLLGEHFGAEYEAYRARTRRLGFEPPKSQRPTLRGGWAFKYPRPF